MYEYRLLDVIRVVDGDTIDARLALGFGLSAVFRFRLYGIDAPETYGRHATHAGAAATAFVTRWFADRDTNTITVRTHKGSATTVGIGDGHFGRWLADFTDFTGANLRDDLAGHLSSTATAERHAARWTTGARRSKRRTCSPCGPGTGPA